MLTCPNNLAPDEYKISFQQLLAPKNLEKALFSSFCVDFEWLLPQIKCPTSILMHPDSENRCLNGKSIALHPNLRIFFPPFFNGQFGVFHAKIMLLWMKGGLRFVISSANLMECDYGSVQNILFVQDLMPCNEGHLKSSCYRDLTFFLNSCKVPLDSYSDLKNYSWDNVNAQIVFSIPGNASSGLNMLQGKIASMTQYDAVEAQGSSLGALAPDWLGKFASNVKIVFPTSRHAHERPGAFGTIFCREDYWKKYTVKDSFYQCVSIFKNGQALHSKIILFIKNNEMKSAYIGSHNFTPSAWGRFTKAGKLFIANYEIGVLLDTEQTRFKSPYARPVVPYSQCDTPWFQ